MRVQGALTAAVTVFLLASVPALAGLLADDANGMGGVWQDTVNYDGLSVDANVDFCVFEPGQFTQEFADPNPAVDPNHYVYAYQILDLTEGSMGAGNSYILQFSVGLHGNEDVGAVGAYVDGNAVLPKTSELASDELTVKWLFDPQIQLGQHSAILYFASPFDPNWDTGTLTGWFPVATHSVPSPVPEPTMIALFGLGSAVLLRVRHFRKAAG